MPEDPRLLLDAGLLLWESPAESAVQLKAKAADQHTFPPVALACAG